MVEAPKLQRRAELGLCADCRHRREQASRRGSVFQRCARADADDRFPRYPPLPVGHCPGHERNGDMPVG